MAGMTDDELRAAYVGSRNPTAPMPGVEWNGLRNVARVARRLAFLDAAEEVAMELAGEDALPRVWKRLFDKAEGGE